MVGLSILCPHAHSTHHFPFTPLHPGQFTFTAASVEAHTEQWSVMLTRRGVVCSFSPDFGWPVRFFWGVCSFSSRRGRCCFPHAQALVLPDLTQLGEELPFSGHSRFLQSGIGYVFLYVLWSGASSLTHRLFGVVFP